MPLPRRSPRVLPTLAATSLALLAAASPAHAQRCLGFAGFGGQPIRVGGVLTTGDDVTTLGADLAFGQPTGGFGSVGIGVADFDVVDESALLVSGTLGTQIPIGTASRTTAGAQLCPVAGLEFRSGPDFGSTETSGLTVRGGISLGTSLVMAPTVRLAPFGTVSLAYARVSVDTPGGDDSESEVGGFVDLGAGLVFGERFTVRPSVAIPIGFEGADARFGLALGVNFGGR